MFNEEMLEKITIEILDDFILRMLNNIKKRIEEELDVINY